MFSTLGGLDHYVQDAYIYSPPFLQLEGFDGFKGRVVQSTVNGLKYNAQANAIRKRRFHARFAFDEPDSPKRVCLIGADGDAEPAQGGDCIGHQAFAASLV